MNESLDNEWKPEPELLAAYFDGELEGRDDAAEIRARIEAWLEANPQAAGEWTAHQQLKKLWLDTTPAEPSAAAWTQVLRRIHAERARPAPKPARVSRRIWLAAGVVAASILLFIGIFLGAMRMLQTEPISLPIAAEENVEMLEVAQSSEVTILRIDTDDIDGVIVGAMPVSGLVDLMDVGEACISCKCPRIVVRQDPPDRPMVWAVAAADD